MKLITFEGIEGVGKSTQINLLNEWLISLGYSVKLLREPGSTNFGEKIRSLLLSKESKITYETELLLMFAARSEMIKNHLTQAKEDFILCDRFYHASIAYQGYGRGLSLEFIDSLVDLIKCPIPELTIIYDLSVEKGFQRKSKDTIDRIESSGESFFKKVRTGYVDLAKKRNEVHLIDANKSQDMIHEETKNLVTILINK